MGKMERINLKTLKVSHYDILKNIESRCYDRLDYLSRHIDDLKREILSLTQQLDTERLDLKACQNEMSTIDAETEAILKAGNDFETVELIRFENGHEYYLIEFDVLDVPNGYKDVFSFGYVFGGVFHISPDEFDSLNEAFEAVQKRDNSVSQGETVMF